VVFSQLRFSRRGFHHRLHRVVFHHYFQVLPVTDATRFRELVSSYAAQAHALLWRRGLALHHLQLLSTATMAWLRSPPRLTAGCIGRGATALSICRGRICLHARAYPPPDWRAAKGEHDAFDGDSSTQTRLRASHAGPGTAAAKLRSGCPLRHHAAARLAKTILRFQRLDRTQARRETPLHASESGEARAGNFSGAVAVEQLIRSYSLGETGAFRVNNC